jgi:hypothetical protein
MLASACQVRQDRRHRTGIPWLGIERGFADGALGVQLLGRRLLGARLDPAKQNSGDDPPPFDIGEPPIGVPGGMGPPAWTTSRAPVMAATVARRCQSFSSADSDTCPIVRDVPFMTPIPGE